MKTFLFVCLLFTATILLGTPTEFAVKGFTITQELVLPVEANTAFAMMTGDIGGWWDHTFSEHPQALFIEPKAGGGFYEMFDDQGHGVRHASVTWAEPGKRLRFEGPLGLAGNAINMVTTWDYEAMGDSTHVICTVNLTGQVDADKAAIVESVWRHFLIEQLQPWVNKQKQK
jgi:hypothetical protein